MIADPYKVLGITESASDDEVKRAYRELSKKYHPDANPANPKAAEEKFKQVQEAYRQITEAREKGTSAYGYDRSQQYGGSGYGGSYGSYGQDTSWRGSYGSDYDDGYREYQDPFGDFFSRWQQESRDSQYYGYSSQANDANEVRAAINYINSGYYQEALNSLAGVPESRRNARWYYVSALANRGSGNNVRAVEHAKRAVDMDPDNPDYNNLLQQMQSNGRWYEQREAGYGPITFSTGLCLSLCALQLFFPLCC